jgi:nitrogen fixation/metabolism regulation signal transduction histidine kinase
MADLKANEAAQRICHDFRQPLNVLLLTSGNLRSRVVPALDEATAAYLNAKLDRIEKQTEILSRLVDSLSGVAD